MNKKKTQRDPEAVSFAQARDEMFSHILRCGVIDALPEHQKDWFDDTMLYLADRYDDLTEEELTQLRHAGRAVLPAGSAKGGDGRDRRGVTTPAGRSCCRLGALPAPGRFVSGYLPSRWPAPPAHPRREPRAPAHAGLDEPPRAPLPAEPRGRASARDSPGPPARPRPRPRPRRRPQRPDRRVGLRRKWARSSPRQAARPSLTPAPSPAEMRVRREVRMRAVATGHHQRRIRRGHDPHDAELADLLRRRRCSARPAAAASSAARARAAARRLAQRKAMRDPDVRRERVHHRAVLGDRQLDRASRLGLIEPVALEVILQVHRGVAPRLLLPPHAARLDPEVRERRPASSPG